MKPSSIVTAFSLFKLSARRADSPFKKLERMMRIELTPSAWKAEVLPLNYIRIKIGAEDEIRTRDPRLGKAMLYP